MTSKTITGPWRTSSFTGGNQQCVELASTEDQGVAVRDTKDRLGGMLMFGPAAWGNLRAHLAGQ